MANVEKVLADLGITLPAPAKPVAAYVPVVRSGNLVFVSGQLPMKEGQLMVTGPVGDQVRIETAAEAAKVCAINALAAIKAEIGSLDKVKRIVKLTVFVSSGPGFTAQPKVANGASEFLQQVFGEAGKHARSAVGSPGLPLNAPVEVEMIAEVEP